VITFEAFELDARAATDFTMLRSIAANRLPDTGLADRLNEVSQGFAMARVRIPVNSKNPRKLIERLIRQEGDPERSVEPGALTIVRGQTLWVLREIDKSTLELGVALGRDIRTASRAEEAQRALAAWATRDKAISSKDEAHVSANPALIANVAFYTGVAVTMSAVAEIDPSQAEAIAREGFTEASRNLGLAAPEGDTRYASMTASLAGNTIVGSVKLGPNVVFERAMWTTAGADVDFADAAGIFQVNGALAYGWPSLPVRPNENRYSARDVMRAVREAGFGGLFVILPDFPFLIARTALEEEGASLGHATLPFMRRFERLGVVGNERSGETVFGLLPKETTEEGAACALTRNGAPCPKAERISATKIETRNGFFIKRSRFADRWLIAASRDKSAIEKLAPRVTVGDRPAIHARVDFDKIFAFFRAPFRLGVGTATARLSTRGDEYNFTMDLTTSTK
jgi:hypothetical protein